MLESNIVTRTPGKHAIFITILPLLAQRI